VLNLKQVMEWVLDPAADVIWDSVKTIYTEAGTKEVKPETDDQWEAVRNAAATLTETANTLMIDGRARDNNEWMAKAGSLVASADKALKAAEAKDVEALFAAGGDVYVSCRACHAQYASHLTASGARARLRPARAAQYTSPTQGFVDQRFNF
jgi:hypothetical protein